MRRLILIAAGVSLWLACSAAAYAASTRNPLDVPLREYLLVVGMSVMGGLVRWLNRVMRGQVGRGDGLAFVGELATSGFVGVLAFFACEWAGAPLMVSAASAGAAGHMGTRAIVLFERRWWPEADGKQEGAANG